MNKRLQEWMLSFACSRCAFMGIQKLGTVHVLGKDESDELQIVAFCYDCARVMMDRRRRRPLERVDKSIRAAGREGANVTDFSLRNRNGAEDGAFEPEATASAVVEESIQNLKTLRSNLERLAGLKMKTRLNLERLTEAVNELKSYTDQAHAMTSPDYSATGDCLPPKKRLPLDP
jgi:hypothetical protein